MNFAAESVINASGYQAGVLNGGGSVTCRTTLPNTTVVMVNRNTGVNFFGMVQPLSKLKEDDKTVYDCYYFDPVTRDEIHRTAVRFFVLSKNVIITSVGPSAC